MQLITTSDIQKIIFIFILNINFLPLGISQSYDSTGRNNWSLGLKFDNPAGITLKKYFGNKAIEFSAGRLSHNKYNHYAWKTKNGLKHEGYVIVDYHIDYDVIYQPFSIQLHYLIHKDIRWINRLTWYYGLGAQCRASQYYFNYTYSEGTSIYYGRKKISSFGIGADAVAGLEYTFKNFPLSLFYDANIYVEAFEHPFYMKFQSGLGFRYNF